MYPDLSTRHDWPVKKGLCFDCRYCLRLAERISHGVCTGSEQRKYKSERGTAGMAAGSEEKWKEVYEAVKVQFELTDLLPEQQEAIKAFFKGRNVFVNLPTGFGKSLIF